jgi:hypothetical protein
MLTTDTGVLTLPEFVAALPWHVREDFGDHLQVSLLAIGLVARSYTATPPEMLTLSEVQRLLAMAAARLETASAWLRSQDTGVPLG